MPSAVCGSAIQFYEHAWMNEIDVY